MKHISYTDTTRAARTVGDWLRVGANISEIANTWAARNDLVAFIGEGATEGIAPALFRPNIAELEINTEKAFGFGVRPEQIGDFKELETRYEFPKATGAILHEAFHARFSRWELERASKDLQADEYTALILLEESRIEKFGLSLDAKFRPFLRAIALELVIGDLELETLEHLNVATSAQLLGLVQARVIAGVLSADEVTEIIYHIRTNLGENNFLRLSEIADEFQQHANHFVIDAAYPLAREWAQIVRDLQEERGEQPEESGEGEGKGEGVSGEGEPSESGKGTSLKELIEALTDAADEVEFAADKELYNQQTKEQWDEEVKKRNNEAKERSKAEEVAKEVFDSKDPEDSENSSAGTAETLGNRTFSKLVEVRAPESSERAAAVIVARMLEKAKYRERDITEVRTVIPQGRLRTRAAVQNAAAKARGQMPNEQAWSHKKRTQTDEPTLTVGVMVDISGSMRPAMQPMATTAWVMSEAVRRVQGKAAMVYYGQDVFPTLKPGQHLDGVKVWTAQDPTEKFDKAFSALDGSLNLLYGNGARLLVVVSDGVYTDAEMRKSREWIKRCHQEGVAVLWLTFDHDTRWIRNITEGTNSVVLSGSLNPADAAVEIGRAAAQALELSSAA